MYVYFSINEVQLLTMSREYGTAEAGIKALPEIKMLLVDGSEYKYPGKVVIFNPGGFYDPFKQQLDLYVQRGMMDAESRALVHFPETVEELEALL